MRWRLIGILVQALSGRLHILIDASCGALSHRRFAVV